MKQNVKSCIVTLLYKTLLNKSVHRYYNTLKLQKSLRVTERERERERGEGERERRRERGGRERERGERETQRERKRENGERERKYLDFTKKTRYFILHTNVMVIGQLCKAMVKN